jgi:hypothetical protein
LTPVPFTTGAASQIDIAHSIIKKCNTIYTLCTENG